MLNLYHRSISAVSDINTTAVSIRYGYAGHIQVFGYHSSEDNEESNGCTCNQVLKLNNQAMHYSSCELYG